MENFSFRSRCILRRVDIEGRRIRLRDRGHAVPLPIRESIEVHGYELSRQSIAPQCEPGRARPGSALDDTAADGPSLADSAISTESRLVARFSRGRDIVPGDAHRKQFGLKLALMKGALPGGRIHRGKGFSPDASECFHKQRVWRRSSRARTCPVTLLRSRERRCRGLRGGNGWLCCYGMRDGLLRRPLRPLELSLEVWNQAYALVI